MSDVPELTRLVLQKIEALGDQSAMEFFEVSSGTIYAWKSGKTPPSLASAQKVFDETRAFNVPEIVGTGKEDFMLGLACYDSMEPLTVFCIMRSAKIYGFDKITVIPKTRTLIDEARNDIVASFLLTKIPYLVMVDADQLLPVGSPGMSRKMKMKGTDESLKQNAFTRIMSHPKEYGIVGGLYRDRRGANKAQCAAGFGDESSNTRLLSILDGKTTGGALEPMPWIGGGMLRIHRSVFEKMIEAAKPGGPLADIAPPKGREGEPYGFFGRSSKLRGEDVFFGRRAESIGIKSHLDTGLVMGHMGKIVY